MKKIFLFASMVLCSTLLLAQNKVTVTGTVTATDDGLGVPAANVMIKGTTTGTFTDDEGKYTLAGVPEDAVLVFSSIGFTTSEVFVNGRMVVNAALAPDAESLDETIVVAYGTAKKGTYTGAASVVKADAIKDAPVTSFESALVGKVPGLVVTQSSGQAGSTSTIQIRGIGSMNASTEPLFVVDGVPVLQGNIGQMSDYTYATNNVMSTLNPDDIESITVLKDAAASALYGSRAANGVVVITTKRGKEGRPVVKFKSSWSISPSWAYNNYEVGSLEDNIGYLYEVFYDYNISSGKTESYAAENALSRVNGNYGPTAKEFGYVITADGEGRYPKFTVGIDPDASKYYQQRLNKYFDWEKALFGTGIYQTYDLSVSGGTDQATYYSSLSYSHEKGRAMDNTFGRVSGRLNLSQKVGEHFEFMTNVNIGRTKNRGYNDTRSLNNNYFLSTRNLYWPTYWPYNYDDAGNEIPYTERYVSYAQNNIYYNDLKDAYSRTLKIQASETLTLHILPGLDAKTLFSYDNSEVLDHYYVSAEHYDGSSTDGTVSELLTNYNKMVSSSTITYNTTLKEKHSLNVLVGFEAERNKTDYSRATGQVLPGSMDVVATAGTKDASAYNWGNAMVSVLSRVEYNYDNKYYFSASFRRDGSSKLSENNRWGNFWSVAGSWRITEEKFMRDIKWVSNLRLRASYGVNGTLPTNNYGWRSLSTVTSQYMGNPGSLISTVADPNLTWETNYTTNLAVEFGLFDQRLYGTVELFNRDSKDLLQDVPLPTSTGYSSTLQNIGSINNKGIEIELGGDIIRSGDWKWDASITASLLSSKVTKLYNGEDITWYDPTGGDSRAQFIYREGESTLAFYGREWAGVNPKNGQQVWVVNDPSISTAGLTESPNDDGYFLYDGKVCSYDYNDANEVILADATPKVYGGINTNLSWKNFSLGLNFIYKIGGYYYDGAEKDVDDDGYYWSRTRSKKAVTQRWRQEGDVTSIPLVRGIDLEDAMIKSSRHIHHADYLRLKTITLSYNLPKNIVQKVGLSNARVYASGTNLLTWAACTEVDPEVNEYSTRGWETPYCKTYTFGLEFTF